MCADIKTIQDVVNRFPNADIHYDGPVTEDTVRAIRNITEDKQLTIWLPLDTPQTAWSKLLKANPDLCKMVKQHARLGL